MIEDQVERLARRAYKTYKTVGAAKTKGDLPSTYAAQVGAFIDSVIVQGFCYTQLSRS